MTPRPASFMNGMTMRAPRKCALHVERPRFVEARDADAEQVALDLRAGMIVEDVDPALGVDEIEEVLLQRLVVGDVEDQRPRLAARGADLLDRLVGALGIAVDHGDGRAFARDDHSRRPADARAGSGHDRRPVLEDHLPLY